MSDVTAAAGGASGLGGTVGARLFLDEAGGDPMSQPSVLYGLGTGVPALALWGLDAMGTVDLDNMAMRGLSDFLKLHGFTAAPAGAVSGFVLPKTSSSGTQALEEFFSEGMSEAGQGSRTLEELTSGDPSQSDGDGSGGGSVDTDIAGDGRGAFSA